MVRRIRHRTSRGTANRYDGKLDYSLPAPWNLATNQNFLPNGGDILATLGDTATSIPLQIRDDGNPDIPALDDDGDGPYDVVFWDIDSTANFGFEQELYIFREPTPPETSYIATIPINPTRQIKSLVILIEDYQSAPIRQGNASDRPIVETSGDDTVVYSEVADDQIFSLEGADDIFSGAGNDLINGGSDADRLVGNSGNDTIYGEAANDALHGLAGTDTIYGGSGNDNAYGGSENDIVYGGLGDDVLGGDEGADTLVGGLGNDVYLVETDTSDTITELVGEGIDTVETELSLTLPDNVERLILRGEQATLGVGNSLDNVIIEEPLADSSGSQPEVNNTIQAGAGNDIVNAGQGDDTVNGGAGNDQLAGFEGLDQLTGGTGADQFLFDSNSASFDDKIDQISDFSLAQGDQIVISLRFANQFGNHELSVGTLAANQFRIGTESTTLEHRVLYNPATGALFFDPDGTRTYTSSGSSPAEQIAQLPTGLALTHSSIQIIDRLTITAPTSSPASVTGTTLNATAGNDKQFGTEGNDTINLLGGDDLGSGQEGNDIISGGDGKDFLNGDSGDDQLLGQAGSDRLYGEAGNDTLDGGSENDTIYGGTGNDSLTGGAGADRFNFYDPASDGADQITDFNVEQDQIGIYIGGNIDSTYLDAGLNPNVVIGSDQFHTGASAADDNDRFIYNRNTGALFFDLDGNGATAQVQIATLPTGLDLTNRNLLAFDQTNVNAAESGTSDNDDLDGSSGNDEINGGGGNDVIDGGTGQDNLNGGPGDDLLKGGAGKDTLTGLGGNDVLSGGAGSDRLEGGNGKDILYGGPGGDRLIGGRGRDIFVLERGPGRDRIEDFRDRQDRLGLTPDLKFRQLTILQRGDNTLIRAGKDALALLVDVQANQITRADFVKVDFLAV